MSRSRISSAGGLDQDTRMLKNTVTKLEHELIQSRANTQKVADQLNCLMLLVKRAWTGDQSAAVNVANIVGVAPPDFEESTEGDFTTLAAKPKSRALNNWAVLAIGVLNREYTYMEKQQEAKARHYLHRRKAYLEEQLLQHRDSQYREAVAFQQKEGEHVTYLKESFQQHQQQYQSQPSSVPHNHHQPLRRVNSLTDVQKEEEHVTYLKESLQQQQQYHNQQQQQYQNQQQQQYQNQQQQQDQNQSSSVTRHHSQPLRRVNSLTDVGRNRQRNTSFSEDLVGKAFITQPMQKQPDSRPSSCKTRAPVKHLYRPASHKQERSNLTWADLVVEPGQQATTNMSNGQSASSPQENVEGGRAKYRQRRVSYDDPRRYNVGGLYDAENALGPGSNAFRKRPISAKHQKQTDDMRARPRSAVSAKNERPLKFETTRPVSASVKTRGNRPPSGKKSTPQGKPTKNQPQQNGHSPQQKQQQNNKQQSNEMETHIHIEPYDSEEDIDEIVYDEEAFAKLGIDLKEVEREVNLAQRIRVDIKKPKSVIEFEQDVQDMHDMERTIRKTAMQLQKKLGIGEEGIVY